MAITFSNAYKNTPEDFQKRVYAQLHAQSIAIAAALALAAKNDKRGESSISDLTLKINTVEAEDKRIYPINEKDKLFAEQHLNDIFQEARLILSKTFPFEEN